MLCHHCLRAGSVALRRAIVAQHGEPKPARTMRISVKGLVHHASDLTGIPVEDLTGPMRFGWLARIRHAIVMVASEYPISTTQIGKAMGGRDHSTVINSRKRGAALIDRDKDFARLVERLCVAVEHEPQGPMSRQALVHEPVEPVVIEAAAAVEKPVPMVALPIRREAGEYSPRHALPPVLAYVSVPDKAYALEITSAARSSNALLAAIKREFPERCAA